MTMSTRCDQCGKPIDMADVAEIAAAGPDEPVVNVWCSQACRDGWLAAGDPYAPRRDSGGQAYIDWAAINASLDA